MREMKESEGTEEITSFPLYPYLLQGQQALPSCKPISVGRPTDKSYRTPSPHPPFISYFLCLNFVFHAFVSQWWNDKQCRP